MTGTFLGTGAQEEQRGGEQLTKQTKIRCLSYKYCEEKQRRERGQRAALIQKGWLQRPTHRSLEPALHLPPSGAQDWHLSHTLALPVASLPILLCVCIMFILILRAGEALGITLLQRETCYIINSLNTRCGQKEPSTCTQIAKHRPSPLPFSCPEHEWSFKWSV